MRDESGPDPVSRVTRAARLARVAAGSAGGRWAARDAQRRRRLRSRNSEPLPNLYDRYPEARGTPSRELGLQTIPVAEIVGTAVEGPDQRGSDFLPPRALRSRDWAARWQRIERAVDRLRVLPPIDVIHAAGSYWVVDGHNRVAAALYHGQLEIDALVRGLPLPGQRPEAPSGSLAAMLVEGDQLRAAGRGLLTPGSTVEPAAGSAEAGAGPTETEADAGPTETETRAVEAGTGPRETEAGPVADTAPRPPDPA